MTRHRDAGILRKERRQLVQSEWPCTQRNDMGIFRLVQGPERLDKTHQCVAPRLGPTAGPGVNDDRRGRYLSHETVSFPSQRGAHASPVRRDARDYQQPSLGQGQ